MTHKTTDLSYIRAYWRYLIKHPKSLLGGITLIPIVTCLHLIQPILLQKAIDNHILTGDTQGLITITIMYAGTVIAEFISRGLQGYIFQVVGQKTITDMRSDLFKHVMSLSSSYFDKTPKGSITSRLTSDIESISESFSSGMITLVGDILVIIGIIITMAILSVKLTIITLIVLPLLFLFVNFFRIKLRHYFNLIRSEISKINASLQEQLSGIYVIQLFRRELRNSREFGIIIENYKKYTIGSVIYDALLYSFIEAFNVITIAVVIYFSWNHFTHPVITIGVLVAFIEYIHRLYQPLKEISNKFAVLQHALASLERIFGLFDIQSSIQAGHTPFPDTLHNITFNNVHFSYPGHEDKPVLTNVSFTLNAGSTLAIVGPTGSGKSTIGRVLTRLYSGYTGQITLNNIDIAQFDLTQLRQHISIVNQDIQLFSDTIRFNITLGNTTLTDDEILTACHDAQLSDFIAAMPNGLDTRLDQGGKAISQGQAQLICIARILASKAPIIVLDEATASVDSLAEKKIQKALEILFQRKTVIVIAHRLSTIQKSDLILTLKDGEIIEKGSHSELLKQKGFYATLFNYQFSTQET